MIRLAPDGIVRILARNPGAISTLGLEAIRTADCEAESRDAARRRTAIRRSLVSASALRGRLTSRPGTPRTRGQTGLHHLGLGGECDGLVYVPPACQPDRPAPLALLFHGAGGHGSFALTLLLKSADRLGIILLAPDARDQSWDILRGGYGPDVAFVDRALGHVFAQYAIDSRQVAIGGFSDGASYALSLGIDNGDLFSHVLAFSPGFMAPVEQVGRPRIFVSHGTRDEVLQIDRCSRRIVPALIRASYDVTYREFDGRHVVPPEIAGEAADWFVGSTR